MGLIWMVDNGDIYLWGSYGKFNSWVPKKIDVPYPGPLHSLFMSDESWILHKGMILLPSPSFLLFLISLFYKVGIYIASPRKLKYLLLLE